MAGRLAGGAAYAWEGDLVMGVCLTRGCTTGWLDWVHGELWLLPHALVRRRLSFAATQANRYGPTVGEPLPQEQVSGFRADEILGSHRTNKYLPFASIAEAQLFRGFTAHGLVLTTTGGKRHKLLWLTADPAYGILTESLPGLLGERLLF